MKGVPEPHDCCTVEPDRLRQRRIAHRGVHHIAEVLADPTVKGELETLFGSVEQRRIESDQASIPERLLAADLRRRSSRPEARNYGFTFKRAI